MDSLRKVSGVSTVSVMFLVIRIKATFQEPPTNQQCRSKFGSFGQEDFNNHACSWCYAFLNQGKPVPLFPDPFKSLTVGRNGTRFPIGTRLIADAENHTTQSAICSTLPDDGCQRWRLCCAAARDCCFRQIALENNFIHGNSTCRSTWDGFGCWEPGEPGKNSHISCPVYLEFSVPTRMAIKTCTHDGTWYRQNNQSNSEWTDYTPCLNLHELKINIYISLGCQIASLSLLAPGLIIFLQYKSLRKQHRIRLHINFFTSFIFSGLFIVLWNMFVTYDKLTNQDVTDTQMFKNGDGCKFLSFLKLYFNSTNYSWMFCEGFYLYRLIANAFSPPKRLLALYLVGWGMPLLFSTAYVIIRATTADESCWALSIGDKEWILYAPNLLCLAVNIFFLGNILRILLTQLQSHPNEPSNFRRALKATFVLIPLFGVHLVVTIYRAKPENPIYLHYERISEIISNTQGFFVALIFCFCNAEVAAQIKRSWRRKCWDSLSGPRKFNTTLSLNLNNTTTQKYDVDHLHSRRNSLEPCLTKTETNTTAISKL